MIFFRNRTSKQMKLNSGAERHHYSMFDVGRSMLDVHLFKPTPYGINATWGHLQNNIALELSEPAVSVVCPLTPET
jgi:hypothetical protein